MYPQKKKKIIEYLYSNMEQYLKDLRFYSNAVKENNKDLKSK